MTCASCGAPLRLGPNCDHFDCDYCGNQYVPSGEPDFITILDGQSEARKCPICRTELVPAQVQRQSISFCKQCLGMLISMEDFPHVLGTLRTAGYVSGNLEPPDWTQLERALDCPTCGAAWIRTCMAEVGT